MSNWLTRISKAMSTAEKDEDKLVELEDSPSENLAFTSFSKTQMRFKRGELSFTNRNAKETKLPDKQQPPQAPKSGYTQIETENKPDVGSPEVNMRDINDKLAALKRLRELPRGSQVESRIAAITDMLGEGEVFNTLKMLRWPQGVICPRCKSTNVVRRDPPPDASDQRHFYVCLNCKGDGNPSDFDDFTGLPLNSLFALRQCILCWYLIGFCSINQIAKVLGLSLSEVIKLIAIGTEMAELPEHDIEQSLELKEEQSKLKKSKERQRIFGVEKQEEYTRSESLSPLKPGYKSKK